MTLSGKSTPLSEHPTVVALQSRSEKQPRGGPPTASEIRQWFLDAGADDVGFVSIDREEIDDQRDDILKAFPKTRTLVSFVVRMNREPILTPDRSVSNLEFHSTGEQVNEVARHMLRRLVTELTPGTLGNCQRTVRCSKALDDPKYWIE